MAGSERTAAAVCPRCAKHQRVPLTALGHECERCLWEWRFAICGTCNDFAPVLEYLESWQCQSCSTFNRSWWKTADAEREAMVVAERRRVENVTHPGRWVAAGGAAVAVLIAAVWFSIPRESAQDREQAAASTACGRFDQLRRDEASGTLPGARLLLEVEAVAAESAGAPAPVRDAAALVAAEARTATDTPAFDTAMTALDQACRSVLASAGG